MILKKFTPVLFFLAAFIMALGVKYIFRDQPKSNMVGLVFTLDANNTDALIPQKISYNFDVKPILSDKCYKCHGPDPNSVEANFRLDVSDHWYRASAEDPRKQIILPADIQEVNWLIVFDQIELLIKCLHQNPI